MAITHAIDLIDVQPGDVLWLSASGPAWAKSERWEALTHRPAFEEVQLLLWQSVPLQKALSFRTDGGTRPVGIIQLTRMDLSIGVAHVEAIFDPAAHAELREAIDQFLDLAHQRFPLRSCYLEAAADTFHAGHLPSTARRCGVLPHHRPRGSGRYVDVLIYQFGDGKEANRG